MASTSKLMEKPGQELPQTAAVQQQPLKCPRCDSSNTKFCYYNNYSLSQPRHFCKACKRYWTRGGTLRNVPVGGGCRKNKRVKRPAASVSVSAAVEGSPSVSTTTTSNPNSHRIPHHQTQIDHISSTSNPINPLFYGLPTNPPEMNLPFPGGRFNTRVDVESFPGGYDLQPQLSSLALGFSSSGGILSTNDHHANNGFISSSTTKAVQDAVTSNSLLSSYSIFGSSTSTTTTAPTIATLLASNLHQNKFNNGGIKDIRAPPTPSHFQAALTSFEDMHMSSGRNECGAKEVKLEAVGENRLGWSSLPCQNQIEQIGFSDPSIYWNTTSTSVGAWHDPANIGSSVTSLI